MKIMRIGVDLGKNVFEVFGVDQDEKPMLAKRLSRGRVRQFFAQHPPALVGMEACPTSHYWARELRTLGHEVRLMAPRFVAPTARATRTTRTMRKLSARRSAGRRCASCRSRLSSSREY